MSGWKVPSFVTAEGTSCRLPAPPARSSVPPPALALARRGLTSACVRFFQFFDQLRRLRMWKMQLLDEHHLFIKYTSEDVVTLRVTDPSQVATAPTLLCAHVFQTPLSLSLSLLGSRSRPSLSSTTWSLPRCWRSLRTPRTSCWSFLRISVTCSGMQRSTARRCSSPARRRPTTTPGRSRGGNAQKMHVFVSPAEILACSETSSAKWPSVRARAARCGQKVVSRYLCSVSRYDMSCI